MRGLGIPVRGERVVVVSPHHDDAVMSIGATLAHLADAGVEVDVLTVFGGDPSQERAPGLSNGRAGFPSTGQAARVRRAEDDEACARLGVRAVRLSFDDDEASVRDPAAIGDALAARLAGADVVLLPGHPLTHPDHRLVTRVAASRHAARTSVGLYLEQPYATWQALSRQGLPTLRGPWRVPPVVLPDVGPVEWQRSVSCARCRLRKLAAMGAYRSQLAVLRRWPRGRILTHELLARGERVAWPVVAGAPTA